MTEPEADGARRRLRIGVLFGGRSGEHEVSLHSARAVMAALEQAGHEVVPIGITSAGRWLVSGDPMHALSSGTAGGEQLATMLPEPGHSSLVMVTDPTPPATDEPVQSTEQAAPSGGQAVPSSSQAVESSSRGPGLANGLVATAGQASGASLDLVFPVLHGTYGEDGTVQGLFELASVPYAGSGVLGSALGMDKVVQKTLWRGLGLPVADFVSILRRDLQNNPEAACQRIEAALAYPCFVKPANLGSSVGVSKARDRRELELALNEAARYDAKLLVERGIDARELEVGVLGNHDPIASVVGEIVPGAEFYDYRAKYLDTGSQALIPADIAPQLALQVQRLAIQAFQSVDAAGLARVDFFLERGSDRLLVNEINTMPGFTEISMYPKLWQASGLTFSELVARIAELALERHTERAQNETTYRAE